MSAIEAGVLVRILVLPAVLCCLGTRSARSAETADAVIEALDRARSAALKTEEYESAIDGPRLFADIAIAAMRVGNPDLAERAWKDGLSLDRRGGGIAAAGLIDMAARAIESRQYGLARRAFAAARELEPLGPPEEDERIQRMVRAHDRWFASGIAAMSDEQQDRLAAALDTIRRIEDASTRIGFLRRVGQERLLRDDVTGAISVADGLDVKRREQLLCDLVAVAVRHHELGQADVIASKISESEFSLVRAHAILGAAHHARGEISEAHKRFRRAQRALDDIERDESVETIERDTTLLEAIEILANELAASARVEDSLKNVSRIRRLQSFDGRLAADLVTFGVLQTCCARGDFGAAERLATSIRPGPHRYEALGWISNAKAARRIRDGSGEARFNVSDIIDAGYSINGTVVAAMARAGRADLGFHWTNQNESAPQRCAMYLAIANALSEG